MLFHPLHIQYYKHTWMNQHCLYKLHCCHSYVCLLRIHQYLKEIIEKLLVLLFMIHEEHVYCKIVYHYSCHTTMKMYSHSYAICLIKSKYIAFKWMPLHKKNKYKVWKCFFCKTGSHVYNIHVARLISMTYFRDFVRVFFSCVNRAKFEVQMNYISVFFSNFWKTLIYFL